MAESSLHDVALKTQSVGDNSPSDAPATTTDNHDVKGEAEEGTAIKENGTILYDRLPTKTDEHLLDEGPVRSDTETSRDNSVAGDVKSSDLKPVKKFIASKPVSFAKYAVPKTSTVASAPPKLVVDKGPTPATSSTSTTPLGRPRLVAKTTSLSQQKLSTYKPAAPDPMQVWNKNRVTPQPSTKHLTDEELKQQYGIHLTSRLQSDNDGKEAKWADIDDDEDDWAPETIEWNDGTKTTVNTTDPQTPKSNTVADPLAGNTTNSTIASQPPKPQYASTVGPNATVLKLGANAERQQAQRALAQQSKGPSEKPPVHTSKTTPAPAPVKSPWAKLPEIDKVSPVSINPQPGLGSMARFPPVEPQTGVSTGAAPSPAKEISADDFNRSWRESPASQTKELFMPSSGRYEAVSDSRRRMSKNEQNFRAPAVLQRPNQRESRAPAEPSAAFQTSRTSVDQGRRRASSSISGGSGQFARRMSFKSADTTNISQPDTTSQRPISRDDEPSPQPKTPATYQARGPDPVVGDAGGPTDTDLVAQRAAQKALMKEKIEKARQRKIEEDQKAALEKQERIRLKLASLGPPPESTKSKQEETSQAKQNDTIVRASQPTVPSASVSSPPKPPQPLKTGEPQQYGMITVHPLDSVKRATPPADIPNLVESDPEPQAIPALSNHVPTTNDKPKLPSPAVNGSRPFSDTPRPMSEDITIPEPSPKFTKQIAPIGNDARVGWGGARNDHRIPQAGNLWGLPNNKALGNGTFDQSLAGYSPQDLSRTSSTGQGWMNGRTPTVGQSPQLHHVNQHVPETRSHLLQSMTSPDSQPLNLNSEADSAFSYSRPVPIGRPQIPSVTLPQHTNLNGYPHHNQVNNVAAWNNFGNAARIQEKAETEKFNREFNERREEEKRTGIRQQAPYNITETFKQVQLGDQIGQRHITHVAQTSHASSNLFGTVSTHQPNETHLRTAHGHYGQLGRGSRFFPQQLNLSYQPERRAATYSHPEVQLSLSSPPAEEYASYHPAFDGDYNRPKVHFPREKPVVRLPPSVPPAPSPAREPSPPPPPEPKIPLTWAARVSMPAPAPPPVRAVSSPIVNNPSWQERFNGLLYPRQSAAARVTPAPALASSREPLDIMPGDLTAAVSLPSSGNTEVDLQDSGKSTSKDVEDEEDLFEDREAGSLPTVHFPREFVPLQYPLIPLSRIIPAPVDPNSIHMFMVSNWSERYGYAKPQYAVIKAPGGSGKGVKRDLPVRNVSGPAPPRGRTTYPAKHHPRPKTGQKPRVASKAH